MFLIVVFFACLIATTSLVLDIGNTVGIAYYHKDNIVTLVFIKDSPHTNVTIEIGKEVNIGQLMSQVCAIVHLDDCFNVMDKFSYFIHGIYYAQTMDHATVEDFNATRIDVVKYFANNFQYQSYLEIGTYHNDLFDKAKTWFPYAIGVDPNEGGTHRMTSDAFFANNTEYFDFIFVDGLHEANQVFRDIHNALKWLKPGGTIMMHDCYPHSFEVQNGTSKKDEWSMWTGDVWKASIALRYKQDIEIVVVDVDFGVGVIRKRPNKHPLSDKWLSELDVNPISILTYELFDKNRKELVRLMTLEDMRQWVKEEENVVIHSDL